MERLFGRILVAGEAGSAGFSRMREAGGAGWSRVAPAVVGTLLSGVFFAGAGFVAFAGISGDPRGVWMGAGAAWAGLPLMRGWTTEGSPAARRVFPHRVWGTRVRWVLWTGITAAATVGALVVAPPGHPARVAVLVAALALVRVWTLAKRGRIAPWTGRFAVGAVVGASVMPNQVRPSLGMLQRAAWFIAVVFFLLAFAGLAVVMESGGILGWHGEGITTAVIAGLVLPMAVVKWQPETGPVTRVSRAARRAKAAARSRVAAGREDRRVARIAAPTATPASVAGMWTPEDPALRRWAVDMPPLGSDPGDVIEWLVDTHLIPIRHEPVLFTGRVDLRRWGGGLAEWATAKPHLLGIGTPGSGKSSTVLAQNVMAYPGLVVTSSSKSDVAERTAAWRSTLGPCLFFDPSGRSVTPDHCDTLRWSPLMGIATRDDAVWSARQLVDASVQQGGSDGEASQHFAARAAEILAPLLYAGVLADRRMSKVVEWVEVGPSGWEEPLGLLDQAGQERLHRVMSAFAEAADGHGGRENHSVLTTVARLLSPYSTDRALAEADLADFEPLSWLRTSHGWPTIYVVTTAGSEARAMGPLVALMMAQVVEMRRRTYSSDDLPMLLALDEIAAAPVPGLSAFVSNDRAFGINCLAMGQTDEMVTENPLYGSSLLSGFGQKVLFSGSGSPRLHTHVEEETTKTRVWLSNVGESEARAGMATVMRGVVGGITAIQGPSASAGASQHSERLLDRAQVVDLPRGQVRFLASGYRALTTTVPDVDEVTGEATDRMVAPPVTLLPPVDKPGPWLALTRWAEATHALAAASAQGAEVEPLSA